MNSVNDLYLDWHQYNDKPIGQRTIEGYWAPHEARIKLQVKREPSPAFGNAGVRSGRPCPDR